VEAIGWWSGLCGASLPGPRSLRYAPRPPFSELLCLLSGGSALGRKPQGLKIVTWLILPVVICLSQRLSHACLSISNYTVWYGMVLINVQRIADEIYSPVTSRRVWGRAKLGDYIQSEEPGKTLESNSSRCMTQRSFGGYPSTPVRMGPSVLSF